MVVKVKNVLLGCLTLVVFFVLSCFNTFALAVDDLGNYIKLHQLPQYKSEDYVVDEYNINIVVNENNSFDVVEKMNVYFNKSKHGLIIGLPITGSFFKPDGSSIKYIAKVSNIDVNDKFEKYRRDENQYIKIGDSKRTITGEKGYTIKYRYSIGRDKLTDVDQLYYNIVSSKHEAPYGSVTFSITMPKDFDESKLGFSAGAKGTEDSLKIRYSVEGNKITGFYDGVLQQDEALTVRCELPEGYFVAADLTEDLVSYLIIGISVIFLIISALIAFFSLSKRPGPLVEPVEFYPPENLNSLDIAYFYKGGELESGDATSLLVYLANKGYIKISQESDDDQNFKITKVKEYDGGNESERLFFEGLFESGKNDVDYYDLYDKFYKTVNSVCVEVDKTNYFKIFKKFVLTKFNSIIFMAAAITMVIAGLNIYSCWGNYGYVVVGVAFMLISLFIKSKKFNLKYRIMVFLLAWGIAGFALYYGSLYYDTTYFIANCDSFVCVVVMIVCSALLPKRTEYGYTMLGRIKGFRNFLVTAEKDKLEALVMDDLQYFYNILPYTYVLGVSTKWIEQFESIALKEPDWYYGNGTFDVFVFDRMMLSTMDSVVQRQESSNTSSGWGSGSSGTGGGVSGGGYGGSSSSSW